MNSIQSIIDQDRAGQEKERRTQQRWALAYLILLPILFFCAATGSTPMVRAGYALMALGLAVVLSVCRVFTSWSRQALPGPVDIRSQLQKAAFLLSRQASLARTSPIWAAPLFLGGALIGLWSYEEREPVHGYAIWASLAALWLGLAPGGYKKAREAVDTRARMEALLRDFSG